MVCTTPITAATMPNAGMPSPSFCDRLDRNLAFVMMGLDLVVHQILDLERVQIAADHEPQVVGDEFDHVVVSRGCAGIW